jgi:4-hydroxy-2-oxoheptanedioate aldolase
MTTETLRDRLHAGEVVVGTFQLLNTPIAAELPGLAGCAFTILDQEHGPLSAETTLAMCSAAQQAGAAPVVRVRANEPAEIQRALDIGAAGVEIPQIASLADAQQAVHAARFAPVGGRGLSPYVRAGAYVGGPEYTAAENETRTVIVHIEGTDGVENIEAIAAVEGIDVLFLGPYDLSQSLGIPGEVEDPRVVEMMERVCAIAARESKVVGTYADTPAQARRWIDAGVQYIAVGVDATYLRRALETMVDAVEHA